MTAGYWPPSHCIPTQEFVSVSEEFNHNPSWLVLNFKKGVCCHHSLSCSSLYELDKQLEPCRRWCCCWKLLDQPIAFS